MCWQRNCTQATIGNLSVTRKFWCGYPPRGLATEPEGIAAGCLNSLCTTVQKPMGDPAVNWSTEQLHAARLIWINTNTFKMNPTFSKPGFVRCGKITTHNAAFAPVVCKHLVPGVHIGFYVLIGILQTTPARRQTVINARTCPLCGAFSIAIPLAGSLSCLYPCLKRNMQLSPQTSQQQGAGDKAGKIFHLQGNCAHLTLTSPSSGIQGNNYSNL